MGFAQSKIDQEEAVLRCKNRKQHMKDAVCYRNAFAAAHSHYVMALKSIGLALNDYGQGEVIDVPSLTTSAPVDRLPPPPPLPPVHDTLPTPPLQKALSMPDLSIPKPPVHRDGPIQEEEEDEDVEEAEDASSSRTPAAAPPPPRPPPPSVDATPPPTTEQKTQWQEYFFPDADSIPGMSMGDPPPPPPPEASPSPTPPPAVREKESSSYGKGSRDSEDRRTRVEEPPSQTTPVSTELPLKAPKKAKQSTQLVATTGGARRGKAGSASLVLILKELDDQFLLAYESGDVVKKMLEANRLHYHSNFADNRGHIDHSARVMRVITWNRSIKGIQNPDDGKDDFNAEEAETHATVLDKLLAWEKKLYDEVKAGESMKIEYQKKVAMLNKQKKRGVGPETLERAKAAVSHLHTRYIVDMQSMDSTVSEICRLRDEQLYQKLVELVSGMAEMWENMRVSHNNQLRISGDLKHLDISNSCKETSESHHKRTEQLCRVASEWGKEFDELVKNQKEYVRALNNWIRLSLVPTESSLKEKVSSPPRVVDPPIKILLIAWNDGLEQLSEEVAKNAITGFAAVVDAIFRQQKEELSQKQRLEDAKKDHERKVQNFQDWLQKYKQKKGPEDIDPDRAEGGDENDVVITDKKSVVEASKIRWDDEAEKYEKLCKQTREKSLGSLKTGLPGLLTAMVDYAGSCAVAYANIRKKASIHRN
ncbi:hypothetical protein EJ110_NYTH01247 [Nymphaea thermarum]|nr:hypothetical protein EJ110_NYTH01247 [Nymphaea thermarum]